MRILYWNCTAPSGTTDSVFADDKCNLIGEIIRRVNPDIVCLDEVSFKISDTATATAFATKFINKDGYACTPTAITINPGYHLNTIVFVKDGSVKMTCAVGIPTEAWNTDGTIRDLARIQLSEAGNARTLNLWCLHANASGKGGKTAVALVAPALKDNYAVFMGDFNASPTDADTVLAATLPKAKAVRPVIGAFTFSQWKADDYGSFAIPGTSGKKCKPNDKGFIDFALASPAMTVTAVDSLKKASDATGASDDLIRRLLLAGDHFPIAFDFKST